MAETPVASVGPGGFSRGRTVDVWTINLDQSPEEQARLAQWLSADERARADRYVFPRHRNRFIQCRGTVRALLGGYLGVGPSAVVFEYGERGKPGVASSEAEHGLRFNVSHSDDMALCVVAEGQEVGVDIERVRALEGLDDIARHFFSPRERELLASRREDRFAAFFACWTRKEAFVKALGEGLGYGLDEFSVSLDPADARVLAVDRDPGEEARWHMVTLRPADGFVGAVAWHGDPRRLVRLVAGDVTT